MKTLVATLVLTALSAQTAFSAASYQHHFATCAGRLSAQLEHQWLGIGSEAEVTETQRDAMVDLFDAVSEDGDRPRMMAIRINAKQAHKALLRRATFNADTVDAGWAKRRVTAQLRACSSLLLM